MIMTCTSISAFTPQLLSFPNQSLQSVKSSSVSLSMAFNSNSNDSGSSIDTTQPTSTSARTRREAFLQFASVASVATTISTSFPNVAMAAAAASKAPTADELNKIKVGYENICYLLDNFDKETTICRENGGECKRDAEPVRRYLGLRSTTDPLFQIEKVFNKVKYMDDVDPDMLEAFFEATEEWNTAVNMSNSMAFISQFGEYNPGGGKDEVLKYLEESKKQVILAKKSLKTIMETIGITT